MSVHLLTGYNSSNLNGPQCMTDFVSVLDVLCNRSPQSFPSNIRFWGNLQPILLSGVL